MKLECNKECCDNKSNSIYIKRILEMIGAVILGSKPAEIINVNEQLNTFWDSYKRFSNPKKYKVDLSKNLWTLKSDLLDSKKRL